jgi:hypothetical protein
MLLSTALPCLGHSTSTPVPLPGSIQGSAGKGLGSSTSAPPGDLALLAGGPSPVRGVKTVGHWHACEWAVVGPLDATALLTCNTLQEHMFTIKQTLPGGAAAASAEWSAGTGPATLPAGVGAGGLDLVSCLALSSQGCSHAMPGALDDELIRDRILKRKTPTWGGPHGVPAWSDDHDLWRPRGLSHLLAHRCGQRTPAYRISHKADWLEPQWCPFALQVPCSTL